jgi:hypothetical protein
MIRGSNPEEEKEFTVFKHGQIGCAAHLAYYFVGIWGL